MINITLDQLFVQSAREGIKELSGANSFMPSGINGPYRDKETPVRNTGHWLMIFLRAFSITEEKCFEDAAQKCLLYLMSTVARPMDATFWHRCKPEKDFTNGLMGQAWTIEALVTAYKHFKDESILAAAKEVFQLHPYDKDKNGWKIVNVDGSIRDFDVTFNHQLWFAAAGAMLMLEDDADELPGVLHFIENIHNNLQLYPDGVIKHIPAFYLKKGTLDKAWSTYSLIRQTKAKSDYIYLKSVGYHGFNLYAIAIINELLPSSDLFNLIKVKKAVEVTYTQKFRDSLNTSKYAYPYNPAGIELSYLFQQLSNPEQKEFWLKEQIARTFDFSKGLMTKNQELDQNTAAARLYEAVRLRDIEISI